MSFLNLTEDLQRHVLTFLSPSDLVRVEHVCKQLSLLSTEDLWETISKTECLWWSFFPELTISNVTYRDQVLRYNRHRKMSCSPNVYISVEVTSRDRVCGVGIESVEKCLVSRCRTSNGQTCFQWNFEVSMRCLDPRAVGYSKVDSNLIASVSSFWKTDICVILRAIDDGHCLIGEFNICGCKFRDDRDEVKDDDMVVGLHEVYIKRYEMTEVEIHVSPVTCFVFLREVDSCEEY